MTVVPDDEYLHPAPADIEGLWSDNLWFSICDREADVFGVNHIHATNKGYARYSTMLVIDGLPMPWANKAPLTATGKFDELGEGRMSYRVVKPLEEIRITFDGPRYGFDLTYRGRFPVFDYRDNVGGNPLGGAGRYGGHYEQGLRCRGEFELRSGRKYAHTVNGLMRGENDAECQLDCYESFFDFEVEETGERGYGCSEYSIFPPSPRWRV
jgi:hypothetical protein